MLIQMKQEYIGSLILVKKDLLNRIFQMQLFNLYPLYLQRSLSGGYITH